MMTSNGSTMGLWVQVALAPTIFVIFLCFSDAPPWVVVSLSIYILFCAYRDYRRRSTLHQRDDGTYVWIEWHGGERCSHDDPSAPDGEWDSDGDGDGGD